MGVNIKIGKFTITSDSMCFTLSEERVRGKESKKAGEVYQDIIGYYPTLEGTLKVLPTKAVMRSNATSLVEVAEEIRKYKLLIDKYLNA